MKMTAKHKSPADTTEAVDDLMKTLVHQHKDAIAHLRRIILGVDASIAEGVKWNAPSFRTTEYFATTNLRTKRGIGVILHLGAKVRELPAGGLAIEDPDELLKWLADDRAAIEFTDASDVRGRQGALEGLLRQWIKHACMNVTSSPRGESDHRPVTATLSSAEGANRALLFLVQ